MRLPTSPFAGGIVRVDCLTVGPNSEQRPSGTLLIPGTASGPILNALVNAHEGVAAQAAGASRRGWHQAIERSSEIKTEEGRGDADRGRVKTRLHDCVGSDTRAGGRM